MVPIRNTSSTHTNNSSMHLSRRTPPLHHTQQLHPSHSTQLQYQQRQEVQKALGSNPCKQLLQDSTRPMQQHSQAAAAQTPTFITNTSNSSNTRSTSIISSQTVLSRHSSSRGPCRKMAQQLALTAAGA